jgi:GT2 family glycosyltransferase/glycosyltransferase involved in cell wall biosynthesis
VRLLLVAHNLGTDARAGTESYCLHLGKVLSELGAQVTFLAPQGPPLRGPQDVISWQQQELAGLPFLTFSHKNQGLANLRHVGFEAAFREILKTNSFDLVHFHHTYLSAISLLGVALKSGVPAALTLHDAWHLCPRLHCVNDQGPCGGPESPEKCAACLMPLLHPLTLENRVDLAHFLRQRLNYVKALLPQCRLLAPSRFLRNLHYRYGVARGGIIHLPLGLDELGPPPEAPPTSPPRFVFLGNIVPVKRVDLAVEAFIPLAGQATLEVWGQLVPPYDQPFLVSIAPHPHIVYQGAYRREDLPGILAGAMATIVPSDFENCPLVVRESLMLKVPVIGSEAGGIPEIIEHGQNGLLFPPGDAGALRRQVKRLLRRPELVERLRQKIAPVKTLAQEAEELLSLYRALVLQRKSLATSLQAVHQVGSGAAKDDCRPVETISPVSQGQGHLSSIIIPVCNNLELTRNCLESIEKHTDRGSCEIIVVDNGSTDGTRQFLEEKAAQGTVKPIVNPANLGFARASNQGANAAAGEYLVFLNNDTLVTAGWLKELTRAAAQDRKSAAVGAKLLYPDDTVQHAGVVFSAEKKLFHIYKHFHRDHPAVNRERAFQSLSAACLLVKREVFFEVGLFNEQFLNGFEDVDLCLKMGSKGWKLLYQPQSVVYHLESKTPGRHARERENAELLASRWINRIIPDAESFYEEDGIMVHFIKQENGELAAIMYDHNPNPFWQQAARLKRAGAFEEACESYLQALQFNPYDSRRWVIGAELADLLEQLGRTAEAALQRRYVAQLLPGFLPRTSDVSCRVAAR